MERGGTRAVPPRPAFGPASTPRVPVADSSDDAGLRLTAGTARSTPALAELVVLTLVLVLGYGLRTELLGARSLWIDEALSLELAERGPAAIWATTAAHEPHPPGYYLLLWAWARLTGLGVVPARQLSLVFGLASVLAGWAVGRRLGGGATGLVAAGLLAVHPFQVFASHEVRMYMPLELLGLLATLTLWRAVEAGQTRWWAAYGVLAAAVLWVSYYGALLLVAQAVWLVPRLGNPAHRRGAAVAAGAAFVCYLPWLPHLASSLTSNPVPWRPPLTVRYVADLLATQAFGGHLWGSAGYLVWPAHRSALWSVALAVPFLAVAALGLQAVRQRGAGSLLALTWALPLVVVVAASVPLGRLAAYEYHVTYLQPYLAVLVAAGLFELPKRLDPRWRTAAALAAGCVLLGILAAAVHNMQVGREYQVYRYDLAARFLRSLRKPGEVAVYYNDVSFSVLRWYGATDPPFVRIRPDPRRWSREGARPLLEAGLRPLRPSHERVWLVLSLPWPEGSLRDLFEMLGRKGYRQTVAADFGGVRVVGLVRGASGGRR